MMDDYISREAAIDALDVLCQEHRYKIPGKRETYSQYNEVWQDALDRAEGEIFNLPSAPVREVVLCKDCVFGHQYFDVKKGITENWAECRNPDGLNRDVSMDGFCYASIRRQEDV